jgi:diadenosine tetraphosphatase ApaH/serine/threonine PP2A family protein phosphatase
MNRESLNEILENLRNLILPSRETLIDVVNQVKDVLKMEENVLYFDGNTAVVGDLHGQFFDFLNMLNMIEKDTNVVFLGDYVDRGLNSVELIIYLLIIKIINKDKIVLLRGNHENRSQTMVYGFEEECVMKYDHYIYWKICEVFELFPVVAIVNQKYFCVHGGISPNLTLEWINEQDRAQEYSDLSSVLWGDPSNDLELFEISQRGAGYIYGNRAVNEFLDRTKCEYLVRSHQLVMSGYEEKFEGKCITIWSAPNYCYKCKNIASFMMILDQKHDFIMFKALENQYKIKLIFLG